MKYQIALLTLTIPLLAGCGGGGQMVAGSVAVAQDQVAACPSFAPLVGRHAHLPPHSRIAEPHFRTGPGSAAPASAPAAVAPAPTPVPAPDAVPLLAAGVYLGNPWMIQHPGDPQIGVEGTVQWQISATGTVTGSLVELDTFDAFGNVTNVPHVAMPVTGTINSQGFNLTVTLPDDSRQATSGTVRDVNGDGTILFNGVQCELHFGLQR